MGGSPVSCLSPGFRCYGYTGTTPPLGTSYASGKVLYLWGTRQCMGLHYFVWGSAQRWRLSRRAHGLEGAFVQGRVWNTEGFIKGWNQKGRPEKPAQGCSRIIYEYHFQGVSHLG